MFSFELDHSCKLEVCLKSFVGSGPVSHGVAEPGDSDQADGPPERVRDTDEPGFETVLFGRKRC